MRSILVTGVAGFIGFHVAKTCLDAGCRVVGVDNLNDYYDPQIKRDRLNVLESHPEFLFRKLELKDRVQVERLFASEPFDRVLHLAAQAGVRYSLENPYAYTESNIDGTLTILEGVRQSKTPHLVFASSSSVYGLNSSQPFSPSDPTNHPMSLYAATKKANEMMSHCYAHLYRIPITGLRFFTAYGPWGRPDMALFRFTKAIFAGTPIDVYNHGRMKRDFTYVDDIASAVVRIMDHVPAPDPHWSSDSPDPSSSSAPFRIYNIGNNQPTELSKFIEVLEKAIGRPAVKNYLPLQPGDVPETYANIDALADAVGFTPSTSIEEGIGNFVAWYRDYYKVR